MKAKKRISYTRILLVDDHPVVTQGLNLFLEQQLDLEVCGSVSSPCDVIRRMKELRPDVVVFDLMLGNTDGLALIREMKALTPAVKILVFTMCDEEIYAERAIKAGAIAYVMKGETPEYLLEGIRRIIKGAPFFSERMFKRIIESVSGKRDGTGSTVEALGDRELHVFQLMGEGLTTKEIASKMYISPKTVEAHRQGIMKKLNMNGITQLTSRAARWVESRM